MGTVPHNRTLVLLEGGRSIICYDIYEFPNGYFWASDPENRRSGSGAYSGPYPTACLWSKKSSIPTWLRPSVSVSSSAT